MQDYLIPTMLRAIGEDWRIVRIDYPQAELAKQGFQTESLALYQGNVPIHAELRGKTAAAGGNFPLELSLQACSDQICLPPETLRLIVLARRSQNK